MADFQGAPCPTVRCRYCQQSVQPNRFHPNQVVCVQPECQQHRRRDYQRQKRATDPEYQQTCCESQKKWREAHPSYQRNYWQTHPQAADRNRGQQRERDQKRRAANLVKNNLALDLKHCSAGVWLVGPGVSDLVKNNLAMSHIVIFQAPASQPVAAAPS